MPSALSDISHRVRGGIRGLVNKAFEHGKYHPTLALVVEHDRQVMLTRHRGVFMLPQGRIRESESLEETAHRILTDRFGMTLPHALSAEWRTMVHELLLYHQNEFDEERRMPDSLGKAMVFAKVVVTDKTTNLNTTYNRAPDSKPPEMVEWVRVVDEDDIEAVRNHYFPNMRTSVKSEAELGVIAIARGVLEDLFEEKAA